MAEDQIRVEGQATQGTPIQDVQTPPSVSGTGVSTGASGGAPTVPQQTAVPQTSPGVDTKDYERYRQRAQEYDQATQAWQQREAQYQAAIAEAKRQQDAYNQWYNQTIAPHWNDPNEFQQDLMNRLVPMRKNAGKSVLEGLADDDYLNNKQLQTYMQQTLEQERRQIWDQVGREASRLVQDTQNWVMHQLGEFQKYLYTEGFGKAFNLYEKTRGYREKNTDDPDFLNNLAQVMRERNLTDIDQAYQAAYGDRDKQREIERAKEEARQEALKQFQEQQARNVTVANGASGGTFPRSASGPASSMEDAMSSAFRELQQRYPRL